MEKVINYLKNMRKRSYITQQHNGNYAFVGIGNHSINNLYPILQYQHISLKYIITNSAKNAQFVNDSFPEIEGTNNFNKVLEDKSINGIFISAHPKSHYKLVKQALQANKNVFVEKPPCLTTYELKDLIEVESLSKGTVLVGLQKCYAPAVIQLQKVLSQKANFNYRYSTGKYPEGDPLFDLFIHPLSVICLLFKTSKIEHKLIQKDNKNYTLLLHISHDKGIGSVEFSTNYSWQNAQEKLIINTSKGIFTLINSDELSFEATPGELFGLPKEKIFGYQTTHKTLYNRNSFTPIFSNNQLVSSGYYAELSTFIKVCENKKTDNKTSLKSLLPLYEMIDTIKSQIQHK